MLDVVENRQAERTTLRGEGHATRDGGHWCERRVQAHGRIGVDDAHAVRADQSDPRGSHLLEQLLLEGVSRALRSPVTSAVVSCRLGATTRTAVIAQGKALLKKMRPGTYQCTITATNQLGTVESSVQKVKVPRG